VTHLDYLEAIFTAAALISNVAGSDHQANPRW